MLSRLFKKKPKKTASTKRTVSKKTKRAAAPGKKSTLYKKLLTAEGWKRMMRRASKAKK